ncbi:chromate efflux transporter [Anabaena sp. FACHB-1237]|uniref:chromate efflux transporter n=1 Tax=Anabaena sp. FACHB-1237 TaxID=2692769 RepID=UPI001681541B|nr:chromate efflux transporter [Anabaena sp. FACHB-1237]
MEYSLFSRLGEIAILFLKLGVIGFGGPVAHIAMIEDEVVKRRRWLTQDHFLDLLGATNLIPGPNSTEMAIHVGYIYAGWLGLIVSGVCFILPAVLITGVFGWVYVNYGGLPQFAPLLYGVKPAVLAVMVNAVWGLAKKAIKNCQLLMIATGVGLLVLIWQVNEVVALLFGGLLGMIWLRSGGQFGPPGNKFNLLIAFLTTSVTLQTTSTFSAVASASIPLWQLGWFFLRVGCVLFGGGYVLIAFLQQGLVQEYGWLTQQQLLDAIAVGQFTPGPVLSTATFIGYVLADVPGAMVATVGIFLPSFVFVVALNPVIPRLRGSARMKSFLDAVNASTVALMAVAVLQLGMATLNVVKPPYVDVLGIAIALISTILITRYHINSAWLVLASSLIGYIAIALGYIK